MNNETLKDLLANATPGPWRIGDDHPQNACKYVVCEDWDYDLATCYGAPNEDCTQDEGGVWTAQPQRDANASLIALAPQLAAEVIRLRAALETIATDMHLGDSLHAICNCHIQVARAALRETQEEKR